MQSQSHALTPPSLPVHWQTLLLLLLPPYHPHWDKSSLLERVKPGLIWTVALPSRSYFWSLLCLQQSYYTTYKEYNQCCKRIGDTHIHRLKTITTIYSFSFYSSLCLEIAGSIFSLITLLDMMHQNLLYLFTGIHWIEHKVSQWIHDWRFAHCTYNSEWHFPDFLFHFFPLLPFTLVTLQITSIKSKTSW